MWTPGNLPANFILFFTVEPRLSVDEQHLLRLLTLGCSDGQISTITGKPVSEVRKQRLAVMRKTGSRSLDMLKEYALSHGI